MHLSVFFKKAPAYGKRSFFFFLIKSIISGSDTCKTYFIQCLHKAMVYFQHLHETGKYGATRYGQKWHIREFIWYVEACKCRLFWLFFSAGVAFIIAAIIMAPSPTDFKSPTNLSLKERQEHVNNDSTTWVADLSKTMAAGGTKKLLTIT